MAQDNPGEDPLVFAAYQLGRQEGLASSTPFQGRSDVADFPSGTELPDSVISYEQRLLRAIPERHREIHEWENRLAAADGRLATARVLQEGGESSLGDARSIRGARRRRVVMKRDLQRVTAAAAEWQLAEAQLLKSRRQLEWVYDELIRVRLWLDSFVQTAEAYSLVRPRLRRTPEPEPPPVNVHIYSSAEEYAAENPARASGRWGDGPILSGADFGYDWTWTDVAHPWITTVWRVSYIEELGEVYAVMVRPNSDAGRYWQAPGRPIIAPVWLFDKTLPATQWSLTALSTSPAWEWLATMQSNLMCRSNSLLVLAEALQEIPDAVVKGLADINAEWPFEDNGTAPRP